ncbi:unnamed protein product [Oncorhynchus mykiss]|uniref:PKD domain-containing protein n=1 Tax=Oncorhynchus mykiss TaxID=8022 RepID=A0A060W3M2_ONCMY|nr:unnamed protein product [Oncorhynchus mykiss]
MSLYFIPFVFQIFDEEYSVLYLDQGGALVAIRHTPLPIRHLWMSFDEGRQWNKYSFTMSPLFVDGLLGEPGEETLIMTIFGHVSHRSEWQLVKIDFRSIFNRRCTEGDYQTWHLHNRGEPCIMGVKRIYRKLKPIARCVMGKTYSVTMTSAPCDCTEADFECDYGYERRSDGKCTPAFWFLPSSMSRSCTTGTTFINSTGYRKVVSNNCTAGVIAEYTARRQHCPTQAPKGLHLVTSEGKLTATLGTNVTFLVFLEEGDGARTSIMVDFGDGHALTYSNVSSIEDGVKHVYKAVGIYRVTATGENRLGSESVVLYLHVTCESVSLTVGSPSHGNQSIQINSLHPILWISHDWAAAQPMVRLGGHRTTYLGARSSQSQTPPPSNDPAVLCDGHSNTLTLLSLSHFSTALEVCFGSLSIWMTHLRPSFNFLTDTLSYSQNVLNCSYYSVYFRTEIIPYLLQTAQDLSSMIISDLSLIDATGVSPDLLLVTVLPGLPTAAEFFLLPDKELTEGKPEKNSAHLDQLSEILLSALNQNLVQFTLRPGVQVTVYAAHLSAAPLVDTSENHSGSAMLMLLSVVVLGLAIFVVYKFKRSQASTSMRRCRTKKNKK